MSALILVLFQILLDHLRDSFGGHGSLSELVPDAEDILKKPEVQQRLNDFYNDFLEDSEEVLTPAEKAFGVQRPQEPMTTNKSNEMESSYKFDPF